MIFDRPDLDEAEEYLIDFGFAVALRQPDRLFLRGAATSPFCYVVERGPQAAFRRPWTERRSLDRPDKLTAFPDASPIEDAVLAGRRQACSSDRPARAFASTPIWAPVGAAPLPHRAADELDRARRFRASRWHAAARLPTPPE